MKIFDVAVIGGGAAGMTAGIMAARHGAEVIILERLARLGKKLLATGNGRCNISNRNIDESRYFGDRGFFSEVCKRFDLSKTLEFFDGIGIPCVEAEDGRLYPRSLQAASVLDMLREELKRLSATEKTDFFVRRIKKDNGIFCVISDSGSVFAKKVIVTGGGAAAKSFGTDGNAYSLLTDFGHRKSEILPSLVQLKTLNPAKALKGVKQVCTASLLVDARREEVKRGEVLFTEYGLSGPPVFDLSSIASRALSKNKNVELSLDLADDLEWDELSALLGERVKRFSAASPENLLNGFMNKRIGMEIVKKSRNPAEIAQLIKNNTHKVVGTMGFDNAQVTAGGILTEDFDAATMQSRLCGGLYAAGEVVNIDGCCGGFNLQWAWTSGAVAGISAAKGEA